MLQGSYRGYDSQRVTKIGCLAFFSCTSLTSIQIPASITKIGFGVLGSFLFCTNLSEITFDGTVEQWNTLAYYKEWNENLPVKRVKCLDGEIAL